MIFYLFLEMTERMRYRTLDTMNIYGVSRGGKRTLHKSQEEVIRETVEPGEIRKESAHYCQLPLVLWHLVKSGEAFANGGGPQCL